MLAGVVPLSGCAADEPLTDCTSSERINLTAFVGQGHSLRNKLLAESTPAHLAGRAQSTDFTHSASELRWTRNEHNENAMEPLVNDV